jgi:hypothetical protein
MYHAPILWLKGEASTFVYRHKYTSTIRKYEIANNTSSCNRYNGNSNQGDGKGTITTLVADHCTQHHDGHQWEAEKNVTEANAHMESNLLNYHVVDKDSKQRRVKVHQRDKELVSAVGIDIFEVVNCCDEAVVREEKPSAGNNKRYVNKIPSVRRLIKIRGCLGLESTLWTIYQ